jgi:hypothetical protein
MNPEQSSISIINKNNGQVTGESSGALPIRLISNDASSAAYKFFAYGFAACLLLLVILISVVKRQVIVVDTTGVSENYVEYKLNE